MENTFLLGSLIEALKYQEWLETLEFQVNSHRRQSWAKVTAKGNEITD